MDEANTSKDDKATTTQTLGQTSTHKPKEQVMQDDGPTHMKVSGTGPPSIKPKSRKDLESMEKEDPASALDCLIAELLSEPSPMSSNSKSLPKNIAADFLQGLKAAAFDQDLFEALEKDASLYNEILTAMKHVQGLRAESDLEKYLSDFEYMLHAAIKGIKQRHIASESLKNTKAQNDEQLDVVQKTHEETQIIKSNLMETGNRRKVLEQEMEELSKQLAIKQQEKALLDEAATKMDEEMKLKAKDGIKIMKGVLESRKTLKGLENE